MNSSNPNHAQQHWCPTLLRMRTAFAQSTANVMEFKIEWKLCWQTACCLETQLWTIEWSTRLQKTRLFLLLVVNLKVDGRSHAYPVLSAHPGISHTGFAHTGPSMIYDTLLRSFVDTPLVRLYTKIYIMFLNCGVPNFIDGPTFSVLFTIFCYPSMSSLDYHYTSISPLFPSQYC